MEAKRKSEGNFVGRSPSVDTERKKSKFGGCASEVEKTFGRTIPFSGGRMEVSLRSGGRVAEAWRSGRVFPFRIHLYMVESVCGTEGKCYALISST